MANINCIHIDRPSDMDRSAANRIEPFMSRWIGKPYTFSTEKSMRRSLKKEVGWFRYRVEFVEFDFRTGYLRLVITKLHP